MIIHTYITPTERHRLSQSDHDYFRRQLETNTLVNRLMHRPVNEKLLAELLCLLDRKPIARRKTEQRNGKVIVRKVTVEEMEKLWK